MLQSFSHYQKSFDAYLGVKVSPNTREKEMILFIQKHAKILRYIPGLQMLAICNSVSMYATHEDSDIDLFIVVSPGAIWYVRLVFYMYFSLFGKVRPNLHKKTRGNTSGTVCLSFFCSRDSLDLSSVSIAEDVYMYFWSLYLLPIVSYDNCYKDFVSLNLPDMSHLQLERNAKYLKYTQRRFSLDWIARLENIFVRNLQMSRADKSWKKLGEPKGVVISDSILKFHDQDRREEIRDYIIQK